MIRSPRGKYVVTADGRRIQPTLRSWSGLSAIASMRARRERIEKALGPSAPLPVWTPIPLPNRDNQDKFFVSHFQPVIE